MCVCFFWGVFFFFFFFFSFSFFLSVVDVLAINGRLSRFCLPRSFRLSLKESSPKPKVTSGVRSELDSVS